MALEVDSSDIPPAAAPATSTPANLPQAVQVPFAEVLGVLGARVDRGEALMGGVASGEWSSSDPGTLIALQAGIYRYSEVVDLAGKLVDRASNAVRTVLQSGH
jgi:hypothetical protein